MKGSSLKSFIVIVIAAALAMFANVVMVSEIKRFQKAKITKQDQVNQKMNSIEAKMVEIQKLTSEDRIIRIAQDSLKLIRPNENLETIFVSGEQIKQIEKLVNQKND